MFIAAFSSLILLLQDPQDQEDRLQDLERKVKELEARQAQTTSANPRTVLNPTVTVIGNFLWRLDNDHVAIESGEEIDDTANLREIEVDFRAAIDPYADGLLIIAAEAEVPGEYEFGIEEFFANIKSLPVYGWERPPLGTKVKIGRFRTEFGRNNRLHLHDLPQSNRPLAVEEFLGEEGHIANGISTTSFLPSPDDTALELTLQALQGGSAPVAQDPNHPAFLANLRFFVQLADDHSFDVSLIGFYGVNDPESHRQSRVWSVDALYRWKPLQGDSQSFVVGGQIFSARHEFHFDLDVDGDGILETLSGDSTPVGYTLWAQYQISRPLYLGVRFDHADFLDDDSRDHRKIQPYASWYLSEFFRLRASVERTSSDDPAEDDLTTLLVELNVIFGSHPSEPFWVNK